MYDNTKSCVRQNSKLSNYFFTNVGVRQGENLSPILFSLFLNDLVEFIARGYDGLRDVTNAAHLVFDNDDVEVYFKLYLLLYADDTVILAESKEQLQAALNSMYLYCQTWKLEVNPSKTKVVIFSKRRILNKPIFTYNGENIDVVDDFVYLGVTFSHTCNGNFSKTKLNLVEQGRKAMFSVLRKTRKLGLPIDIQLQMFDSMVSPILLYGSEVYGFENCSIVESIFLQFYKIILHFKKSTSNNILYGELGRFPSDILIKARMIGFWKRVITGKQDKISSVLYRLILEMHMRNTFHSKWLSFVENILNSCGFSHYWLAQHVPEKCNLTKMVKERLIDQFKQIWFGLIYDSAKCLNYIIFKTTHCFESYIKYLPDDLRIALSKFRCVNHKLPIERGRFWGVARDDRICDLCNSAKLGDEYHYIFECTYLRTERQKFIPKVFWKKPNVNLYLELFTSPDKQVIFRLAKFCKIILALFS